MLRILGVTFAVTLATTTDATNLQVDVLSDGTPMTRSSTRPRKNPSQEQSKVEILADGSTSTIESAPAENTLIRRTDPPGSLSEKKTVSAKSNSAPEKESLSEVNTRAIASSNSSDTGSSKSSETDGIIPGIASKMMNPMAVVMEGIKKVITSYALAHGGQCPQSVPSITGEFGYGAGCHTKACTCPGTRAWNHPQFEECATKGRTGAALGSGITATAVVHFGYCRKATWLYAVPVFGAILIMAGFYAWYYGYLPSWLQRSPPEPERHHHHRHH